MEIEQDQTLNALQTAIQMEIDGKEYYLEASRKSSNKLGRELLQTLAAEEDLHRQKFQSIFDTIRNKKEWPTVDFQPEGGTLLRTILARAEGTDSSIKASATELDAVQTAIDMESKTYDFYKSQGSDARYGAERDFYEALAAEEREHQLVLLDYHEYLRDPAAWFVNKERPSLDGG
ncbi:MAG TPA: ferritin family protein [Dehalococcoidales bacterium]|nr:ferritin family protein [Dehalococcoidales bacterium]